MAAGRKEDKVQKYSDAKRREIELPKLHGVEPKDYLVLPDDSLFLGFKYTDGYILCKKGCDFILMSINNEKEIKQEILQKASKENTPILIKIKEGNIFKIYGDPIGDGPYGFTQINSKSLALNNLPFEKKILKWNDPLLTPELIDNLQEGHSFAFQLLNIKSISLSKESLVFLSDKTIGFYHLDYFLDRENASKYIRCTFYKFSVGGRLAECNGMEQYDSVHDYYPKKMAISPNGETVFVWNEEGDTPLTIFTPTVCDLILMSINDDKEIKQEILDKACKEKTPILIKNETNNTFKIYGDLIGDGIYGFTQIDSKSLDLNKLSFKEKIIKHSDPLFTPELINILKRGHLINDCFTYPIPLVQDRNVLVSKIIQVIPLSNLLFAMIVERVLNDPGMLSLPGFDVSYHRISEEEVRQIDCNISPYFPVWGGGPENRLMDMVLSPNNNWLAFTRYGKANPIHFFFVNEDLTFNKLHFSYEGGCKSVILCSPDSSVFFFINSKDQCIAVNPQKKSVSELGAASSIQLTSSGELCLRNRCKVTVNDYRNLSKNKKNMWDMLGSINRPEFTELISSYAYGEKNPSAVKISSLNDSLISIFYPSNRLQKYAKEIKQLHFEYQYQYITGDKIEEAKNNINVLELLSHYLNQFPDHSLLECLEESKKLYPNLSKKTESLFKELAKLEKQKNYFSSTTATSASSHSLPMRFHVPKNKLKLSSDTDNEFLIQLDTLSKYANQLVNPRFPDIEILNFIFVVDSTKRMANEHAKKNQLDDTVIKNMRRTLINASSKLSEKDQIKEILNKSLRSQNINRKKS